jgi:hypothetical protein
MRLSNVETVDDSVRAIHQMVFSAGLFLGSFATSVLLTPFDQQRSQLLNRYEEFVSNLFFQHLSKQTTKRADITPQRRFLQIAVVTDKLSQPRCLIVNLPEWFPSPHVSFLGSRKSISQLDKLMIPDARSSSDGRPQKINAHLSGTRPRKYHR